MVDDEDDEEEQEQGFQDILDERPQLKAQMKREPMIEEDIKIPVRNAQTCLKHLGFAKTDMEE